MKQNSGKWADSRVVKKMYSKKKNIKDYVLICYSTFSSYLIATLNVCCYLWGAIANNKMVMLMLLSLLLCVTLTDGVNSSG